MTYPILTLKADREAPLKNRHHAIYRTAFGSFPDSANGSIVEVVSAAGEFLCYATLNRHAYIAGRAFAFQKGDPSGDGLLEEPITMGGIEMTNDQIPMTKRF